MLLYLCIMAGKKSRFYSIFNSKCPVCHEGEVWVYSSLYNIKKFDKMHERCAKCGHKYEKEVGFFYGAMYVAYALTVALSVATFVLTYLIYPETPYWMYLILIFAVLILMAPITFRLSRMAWMNMFNKYKGKDNG